MLQYGVPVQALPIDPMGTIRTDNHMIWILDRYKIEQQKMERKRGSASAAPSRTPGPTSAASPATTPLHHVASAGSYAPNSLATPPPPPHLYSSTLQRQPQELESSSSSSSRVLQWTSLLLPFLKPGPTSVASNAAADGGRQALDPASNRNNSIGGGDASSRYFAEPLPNDVIIRDRGKTIDQNEGNKRFVRLIEMYCPTIIEEHNGASKLEKVHVINKLRRLLEERHEVRFIKRLENNNTTTTNGQVQGQQVQLRVPHSLYMVVDPDNNEDNQFVKNKISRALRRTHQSNEEKKHKMQEG